MARTIFTMQAELAGLTPAQRTNGATVINNRIGNLATPPAGSVNVDPNYTKRGVIYLFVEINDFATRAQGDDIFDTALTWASTRSEDAVDSGGTTVHSYIRLAEKHPEEGFNIIRYSQSPGWAPDPDGTVVPR